MQRSSSDCPEVDEEEGGADRGAEAVSVGSDIGELGAAENEVNARCHAGWSSCLETSSYARALQGEPLRCFAHFAGRQIVASQLPLESYFRA